MFNGLNWRYLQLKPQVMMIINYVNYNTYGWRCESETRVPVQEDKWNDITKCCSHLLIQSCLFLTYRSIETLQMMLLIAFLYISKHMFYIYIKFYRKNIQEFRLLLHVSLPCKKVNIQIFFLEFNTSFHKIAIKICFPLLPPLQYSHQVVLVQTLL